MLGLGQDLLPTPADATTSWFTPDHIFHTPLFFFYAGWSQQSVHLQRSRGSVCLPEDSVSTHGDANRRVLAGGRQKHKIAVVNFGKVDGVTQAVLRNPPIYLPRTTQTEHHSYSSYPEQTQHGCSAETLAYITAKYLLNSESPLSLYSDIALYIVCMHHFSGGPLGVSLFLLIVQVQLYLLLYLPGKELDDFWKWTHRGLLWWF